MKLRGDELILRSVYLTFRLDRQLKRVAFQEGVTKNEMIRRLLAEALEARTKA